MIRILKLLISSALIIFPIIGHAQELRSSYFMQTSIFKHQLNPALINESYIGVPFLGNINVGTVGNIGLGNFIYELPNDPKYSLTTFMSPTVSADQFLGSLKSHNKIDTYINLNLFSVGFKAFKGINIIEMNLRSNSNVNIPKSLFEFMKEAGAKDTYNITDMGISSQNYVEVALGHSHKINNNLTIGAKLKFLIGGAYIDTRINNVDVKLNGDVWSLNGNVSMNAAILNSTFKYKVNKVSSDGRKQIDGFDTKFGIPSIGGALDLGLVYNLPCGLSLSAGATDLGFIKWNKSLRASSNGSWSFDGFKAPIHISGDDGGEKLKDQLDDIGDQLEDAFAVYDDGTQARSSKLAATINAGIEYRIPSYNKLSFGLLYTSRIHSIYSWNQAMVSANYRPAKWFEIVVNSAYSSTGLTYGGVISFRANKFNLFIGADRILGTVSKQYIPLNNMNSNINFGMSFSL